MIDYIVSRMLEVTGNLFLFCGYCRSQSYILEILRENWELDKNLYREASWYSIFLPNNGLLHILKTRR
jgi:hypothetical protein